MSCISLRDERPASRRRPPEEPVPAKASDAVPRELAHRASNGLEVWLLWSRIDNRLFVLVVDSRLDDSFELTVQSSYALDAFAHPYAYAASLGIGYRTDRHSTRTLTSR